MYCAFCHIFIFSQKSTVLCSFENHQPVMMMVIATRVTLTCAMFRQSPPLCRERQMKTSAPPHLSANNMKCESFDLDSTIATSSSMLRINWHRICNTIIKLERIIRKLEASCIWFSLTATVKMSHKGKMGWTHIFILSIKHVMLAVGHDHCWIVCWLSYFLYLFYFPCASEWWHFWD